MKNAANENFIFSMEQRLESVERQLKGNKFLTSMDRECMEQEVIDLKESIKKYKK